MAKHEQRLIGDIDLFVKHLDSIVIGSGVTAKSEAATDQRVDTARMVVRVYERYSAVGASRVSLCVAVLASGTELAVSAITAGGSRAVFWKVNTWGEEAFLKVAVRAIESFR